MATTASLDPTGVFQYKNDIYIADTNNHGIRKIDRNGIISTIAGTGESGYNGDGILATDASLCQPYSVFVHNDQVFISDHLYCKKILPNGIIKNIEGVESGFNGDDMLATQLHYPKGIFVDFDSHIYIADVANNCIRRIDQNGIMETGEKGYSGDV